MWPSGSSSGLAPPIPALGAPAPVAISADAAVIEYQRRRAQTHYHRGTFLLESFLPRAIRPPLAPPGGTAPLVTVDLECWNAYWPEFNEIVDDGRLREFLRTAGRDERRRVVVKYAFGGEGALVRLLSLAGACGVAEHVQVRRDETSVQFTTAAAAGAFAALCEGADVRALCCGPSAAVGPVPTVLIFPAFTNVESATLLLGRRVEIGSPFVDALFGKVFDATKIEYQPAVGGFLITFACVEDAKVAHHALHRSLARVFRLSLTFTAFPDAQAAMPFECVV